MAKVIISCAITVSVHTPTMSRALPITPEEIASQAIEAEEAGAAILHLHARVPEDGRSTGDPEIYQRFLPTIKQATDAVVNITTGGAATMSAGAPGRRRQVPAGNLLTQHGFAEFRIFPGGKADQRMEILLGKGLRR